MGLCPDCKSEGETVSYIGASRADVVEGIEPDGDEPSEEDEPEPENVEVCDLCEEGFVPGEEG
jgi:hypothetical protein